ncbi:hypothetical protein KLO70_18370 [Clostridioides difficile]|nr:hypothetical protein [Clostridioides difficile]
MLCKIEIENSKLDFSYEFESTESDVSSNEISNELIENSNKINLNPSDLTERIDPLHKLRELNREMYDGLELMKEQLNSMSSKAISKKIANEEVSNETGKEVIINKRIKNNNIFEEDN